VPAFVLFGAVVLWPIVQGFRISLYQWNPVPGAVNTFVGLGNYTRAFHDERFLTSLVNSSVYMIVTVPAQAVLGFLLALLLHQKVPGRTFYRAVFYLPVVSSWVVVSLLFRYLFATEGGLLNWLLVSVLHVVDSPVPWLEGRWTAMTALCILGIWKGVGWAAVIFLAALQTVPQELLEAAAIDGAGPARWVWHVMLPAVRRTLSFVVVLLIIGSFNVFISVLLLTGGGPAGSTEVPLTYLYRQSFTFLDFGYGSALAFLVTLLILVLSVTHHVLTRSSSEEATA